MQAGERSTRALVARVPPHHRIFMTARTLDVDQVQELKQVLSLVLEALTAWAFIHS